MSWINDLRWTKTGEWDEPNKPLAGRSVAIVGGGPGLTGQHVKALRGRPVILVNNAYQLFDGGSLFVALDRRWFDWHGKQCTALGNICVSACRSGQHMNYPGKSYRMEKDREGFYDKRRHALTGKNSGHAAAHLAMHLGAQRIYLAGFDMDFPGGKSHWHPGHNVPSREINYEDRFKPRLEKLARFAYRDEGVLIAAITRTSAEIPSVDFDIALEDLGDA